MTTQSSAVNLFFAVAGIYGSFLTWGYLQERITSYTAPSGERFSYTGFLNLVFYSTSVLLALLGNLTEKGTLRSLIQQYPSTRNFAAQWGAVALSNTLASALGYSSLNYIPYPVHLVAKSSKLIPVMLGGYLVNKKRYTAHEIRCCLLITLGVVLFSFGPKTGNAGWHGARSTVIGLGLVLCNLICDGFTNAYQDAQKAKYGVTAYQMMLLTNLPSCVLLLAYLFVPTADQPAGVAALRFIAQNPSLVFDITCFALCGAIGQSFIFYTIVTFGTLTCQTVTLTRKACQIILSIVFFGHQIASSQWVGCVLVFGGLSMKMFAASQPTNADQQGVGAMHPKSS